jgi:hypothetical protein
MPLPPVDLHDRGGDAQFRCCARHGRLASHPAFAPCVHGYLEEVALWHANGVGYLVGANQFDMAPLASGKARVLPEGSLEPLLIDAATHPNGWYASHRSIPGQKQSTG